MTGDDEQVAPVIPLFGGNHRGRTGEGASASLSRTSADDSGAAVAWNVPGADHPPRLRALRGTSVAGVETPDVKDPDAVRTGAEEALVRKLRSRSLSLSESRTFLRGFAKGDEPLSPEQVEDIIDDCERRGYLDDEALASQLVSSGVDRKGQGRIALGRSLAQRGIPRDIIDRALDVLPDDDLERAIEFAQSKMRSLARLDTETAKRRLSGQLARRGYSGGVVSAALRAVMRPERPGSRPSGVRFE